MRRIEPQIPLLPVALTESSVSAGLSGALLSRLAYSVNYEFMQFFCAAVQSSPFLQSNSESQRDPAVDVSQDLRAGR